MQLNTKENSICKHLKLMHSKLRNISDTGFSSKKTIFRFFPKLMKTSFSSSRKQTKTDKKLSTGYPSAAELFPLLPPNDFPTKYEI